MRLAPLSALVATAATSFLGAQPPAGQGAELANVAAFARLYGVVRYFYPSDAAADLDWNRLAVHGVAQVRPAADVAALRLALERTFDPLGPGIQIGPALPGAAPTLVSTEPLVAWRYLGPGFAPNIGAGPYRGARTHRTAPVAGIDGFATLMQTRPADRLRGRRVRLSGQVRAATPGGGGAALWLRVDRPQQAMGFFDNMQDRPIREERWQSYSIEGPVAEDAVAVAFGAMASGIVTADFDALQLEVREEGGPWIEVTIPDPGFEAAVEASAGGWIRAGTSRNARVSRPSEAAPQGRQFLRFAPAPAGAPADDLIPEAPPRPEQFADLDLGSGLRARVPLVLADSAARVGGLREAGLHALRQTLAAVPASGEIPSLDGRLADVVVAWNVLRHFYPYWAEAGVDWDAHLQPQLQAARAAATRAAHHDALRALMGEARDGHGFVSDPLVRGPRANLPLQLGVVEGLLVVTASATAEAPAGAVVRTIDGVRAEQRLADATRLASGSSQWREVRAATELAVGPPGTSARLGVDRGTGSREITLAFDGNPPSEPRPGPLVEIEPGIWYVDLTRADMAKVTPSLPALASARGVVFDLRGYPTDAGGGVLPHLLEAPEADLWMHVPKLTGPFGQSAGWWSLGWNMKPASPRISGRVVFLTDGRAISYAESVMGYVRDRKLGTVVGRPTAGTNGNVATFGVPSGFTLGFTGMRVTGHDGAARLHLVGVKPDVFVAPTLAGLRSGRDEVLERGLTILRASSP